MVKKYIIMCGGEYQKWETPRHFTKINGEEIVARTIRLLRENGIKDISISTNNPMFEKFGVPILKHNNLYIANGIGHVTGDWFNAFYPIDKPVCYIFGDVVFSPQAIKTIVETETDDIELFGSMPPFADNYIKTHEEPFALKVVNTKHLWEAIEKTRELDKEHKFWRKPLVWELFTVIKNAPLQKTMGEYTTTYTAINDYSCDIDNKEDIVKIQMMIGGIEMVKLEALESFTLRRFNEIKIVERKGLENGNLINAGDIFTCTKELADYLLGGNAYNKAYVKVIEIIPEEKKEEPKEEKVEVLSKKVEAKKPIKKTTKRISKR